MQLSVCDSLRKMDPKENKNGHSTEILFLRKKKKKRGSRLFHPIIISIIKYSNIHKRKNTCYRQNTTNYGRCGYNKNKKTSKEHIKVIW